MAIGEFSPGPILDTCIFGINHPDEIVEALLTNTITSKSLDASVDDNGFDIGLFHQTVDHLKSEEVASIKERFRGK